MEIIEDLPFYLVIFGVIGNLVIGFCLKVSFTALMIRSVAVTIIFSLLGYLILSIHDDIMKFHKTKKTKVLNNQSIDYTVPPISDDEFIKYRDDEDFIETNPSELHKYKTIK